jgi:hypothetical protein
VIERIAGLSHLLSRIAYDRNVGKADEQRQLLGSKDAFGARWIKEAEAVCFELRPRYGTGSAPEKPDRGRDFTSDSDRWPPNRGQKPLTTCASDGKRYARRVHADRDRASVRGKPTLTRLFLHELPGTRAFGTSERRRATMALLGSVSGSSTLK